MTKEFLHVGCGSSRKDNTTPVFNTDDWNEVRLDIDENAKPDIVASLTDMSVIKDATYDAVYSSHNIEHLYAYQVPQALLEIKRVLKDDGYFVVTCPDLESVCKVVADGNRSVQMLTEGEVKEKVIQPTGLQSYINKLEEGSSA